MSLDASREGLVYVINLLVEAGDVEARWRWSLLLMRWVRAISIQRMRICLILLVLFIQHKGREGNAWRLERVSNWLDDSCFAMLMCVLTSFSHALTAVYASHMPSSHWRIMGCRLVWIAVNSLPRHSSGPVPSLFWHHLWPLLLRGTTYLELLWFLNEILMSETPILRILRRVIQNAIRLQNVNNQLLDILLVHFLL